MNNENLEENNRPLLSIVTINLNNCIQLKRTLLSLEQFRNRSDVQLIFVDGASTDNSLSLAALFYEKNNIISEADTGIYNAMNKGLRRATGKYVSWLNSGDVFKADVLLYLLTTLEQSQADIVSFGLDMYAEGQSCPSVTWIPSLIGLPRKSLPHPTTFFNTQAVLRHGGYNENYRIASDRDLIVRMYLSGCRIETHETVTAIFFLGGASGRSAQPPPKRELMRECSHGETSAECAADFPPS